MTPHSAGIALLLIAALLLQSLMPKGVMAGDRSSADGAWLVLCGDVFDLSDGSPHDDPAQPSTDSPCSFGFLTGLGVLHGSAFKSQAVAWVAPVPPTIRGVGLGPQPPYLLPLSRAPPLSRA